MRIWFDAIALAAGIETAPDHRTPPRRRAEAHGAPAAPGLARRLRTDIGGAVPLRAFEALRLWHKRRKAIQELAALDDRTLRDIGIARGQIRELVDARLRAQASQPAPRPRPAVLEVGGPARPCLQPC